MKRKKESDERHYYVKSNTVPREIPPGMVLHHNHIAHTLRTPSDVRGFRGWFRTAPLPGFKKCGCGWSGLPHYSRNPDYKCPPRVR
jgi:hypothetical protein